MVNANLMPSVLITAIININQFTNNHLAAEYWEAPFYTYLKSIYYEMDHQSVNNDTIEYDRHRADGWQLGTMNKQEGSFHNLWPVGTRQVSIAIPRLLSTS